LHIEHDATVPGGTADVAGETISYTMAVTNTGSAAIANVVVSDVFTTDEAPVLSGGFNVGDTDHDNLLDVSETWQFTASHVVTQAELDAGTNIVSVAVVTGDAATGDDDDASIPVVQNPDFSIAKSVTSVSGGTADNKADSAGDIINYSIVLSNTGNQTLSGVTLSDPFASTVSGHTDSGAGTHGDGNLDVGEVWTYTATHSVSQAEIDAGVSLVNLATADTDQTGPRSNPNVVTTPVV
jgi:uncharacterized repeat protein (TIGR01451 family)